MEKLNESIIYIAHVISIFRFSRSKETIGFTMNFFFFNLLISFSIEKADQKFHDAPICIKN